MPATHILDTVRDGEVSLGSGYFMSTLNLTRMPTSGHLPFFETNRSRSKRRLHYPRRDIDTSLPISTRASSSSSHPTRRWTSPLCPLGTTALILACLRLLT